MASQMSIGEPSNSSFEMHILPASNPTGKNLEISDLESPPSTAVEALEKWNYPRINMFRVFATFWSFFVTGMNDGSYGVSLPPQIFQKLIEAGFSSTCTSSEPKIKLSDHPSLRNTTPCPTQ